MPPDDPGGDADCARSGHKTKHTRNRADLPSSAWGYRVGAGGQHCNASNVPSANTPYSVNWKIGSCNVKKVPTRGCRGTKERVSACRACHPDGFTRAASRELRPRGTRKGGKRGRKLSCACKPWCRACGGSSPPQSENEAAGTIGRQRKNRLKIRDGKWLCRKKHGGRVCYAITHEHQAGSAYPSSVAGILGLAHDR